MPPQTAAGKVLWHFTMSLDGFVAGPGHSMDWLDGFTGRDGIIAEYTSTTAAVLGGRDGWDRFPGATYGGEWEGETFVLTHHLDDTEPFPGVTFLDCDVADADRADARERRCGTPRGRRALPAAHARSRRYRFIAAEPLISLRRPSELG